MRWDDKDDVSMRTTTLISPFSPRLDGPVNNAILLYSRQKDFSEDESFTRERRGAYAGTPEALRQRATQR